MAEFPALPLWTDAYLADTRHLTTAEHGAYLLLLIECWRRPRCTLPNDDELLSRLVSASLEEWMQLKQRVMSFWTLDKRTQEWRQKRLGLERRYVLEKHKKQSDRAVSGWKKRKQRDAAAMPEGMPDQCRIDAPTPTPTPIKESIGQNVLELVPEAAGNDSHADPFVDFWNAYPRRVAKTAAAKAYRAAVKTTHPTTILAGLDQAKAEWTRKGTAAEFIPHASTWLNGRRWEDGELRQTPPEQSPHVSDEPTVTLSEDAKRELWLSFGRGRSWPAHWGPEPEDVDAWARQGARKGG